jgi:hypothetical protein
MEEHVLFIAKAFSLQEVTVTLIHCCLNANVFQYVLTQILVYKPFNDYLKLLYSEWLQGDSKEAEMMIRIFKKCCISDDVDGRQDEKGAGNVGSEYETR